MNNDVINKWLETHRLPLQKLAVKHNVSSGEVLEITELYLLINCTTDVMYLYNQLEWYGNNEFQKKSVT